MKNNYIFQKNQQENWHCLYFCKSLNVWLNRRQPDSLFLLLHSICCDVTLRKVYKDNSVSCRYVIGERWPLQTPGKGWGACWGIRKITFYKMSIGAETISESKKKKNNWWKHGKFDEASRLRLTPSRVE